MSDLVPSNPGYEVFAAHEETHSSGNRGATMRDAATGKVLWSIPATADTGRAASGDIDPRHEGAEGWAIGGSAAWNSPVGQLKSATGELISTDIPPANFLAWFDGDPLREIVDHTWDASTSQGTPTVSKWNWETSTSEVILSDTGARTNNSTKGTPNLQADLFGDWREEIVWRSADSSELRIDSTTVDLTDQRHPHPAVRPGLPPRCAWQNTGYNQPPHTSFFLGDGMAAARRRRASRSRVRRPDRPMPRHRSSRDSRGRHAPAGQRLARAGHHGDRSRVGRSQPRRGVRRGAGRTRRHARAQGQGRHAHADRPGRQPRRRHRDSIRHGPRVCRRGARGEARPRHAVDRQRLGERPAGWHLHRCR